MARFILNRNTQPNGDKEVHNATIGCDFMPFPENQIDLGIHVTCHGAVAHAERWLPGHKINGCYYCCRACHTS